MTSHSPYSDDDYDLQLGGGSPELHGIPPSNIGPLSNGLNPILFPSGEPLIPLGPSKPRFFDRFKFLNRRPPFNQFFLRRPSKLGCVSFWHIARIAVVVLLMVTLLFNFDPLKGVLNVESAEKRASAENATLALEKANTERERELMAHERESWEKAREARAPQGAFWNEVWPAWDCRAYGKREYWGSLRNIPKGWDAMDACMNMPVEIKGVKIRRPDRCARVFVFPEVQVQGFWVVDWDQPDCKAWYHNFEDKGCTSSFFGKRQIEAEIVGINDKRGQDWRKLCLTTPLVWDMKTYTGPTSCEERGWGQRRVAILNVPDETCRLF